MKIVIVGNGGREHAIAKKMAGSVMVSNVFVVPGNPGMKSTPKVVSVNDIQVGDEKFVEFCHNENIDFVIIGPEGPLADGVSDRLRADGIAVLGPSRNAARLESSKAFAKDFMDRYEIPTAGYNVFHEEGAALKYLDAVDPQTKLVVKADGLAAGKGVFICDNTFEAQKRVAEIFSGDDFVVSDETVVIEEFMEGRELSVFVLADGENYMWLGTACDYKRLLSGGLGPNTGGMGAFTPGDWPGEDEKERIDREIVQKTLVGMKRDDGPYSGILYFGLMMTAQGPKVVEYNVRLGDPEAQIVLPLIETDLAPLFKDTALGQLDPKQKIKIKNKCALHVVMTSKDYANLDGREMLLGKTIHLNDISYENIFFSAVSKNDSGSLVNSGGRVLGVTAFGDDLGVARKKAYEMVSNISFEGAYWRDDIGVY